MRTLYLDCFAGVSGDMFIGAMLACGLDFAYLQNELAKLGLTGYELTLESVDRCGITSQKFDVLITAPPPEAVGQVHTHADGSTHSHAYGEQTHDHQRALSEIQRIINDSTLSANVKTGALAIFQRIGEAEAKIHNIPLESVHFHEVGALDSIIDIVGACIALEALKIDRIIASPLHVGYGTFKCAHGIYPIPGPAATEILQGVPIYAKDIEGELVTPTGAAIVATLAERYEQLPALRIERSGYGAGTRIYPNFPNVLRAIIGTLESDAGQPSALGEAGAAVALPLPVALPMPDALTLVDAHATPTTICVLEAQLDDLSPQVFGYVMDLALQAGALDVFYTPVQMKKNRPGVLLTLLCKPADRELLLELLFRETTTLGVRYRHEEREILVREFVPVETQYGTIRMKLGRAAKGQLINAAPEFTDCQLAAETHHVALRVVQAAAIKAFQE